MRLNKYLAHYQGISRREADNLISARKVYVDGELAVTGQQIKDNQVVEVDGSVIDEVKEYTYLMLNKPEGYVCSRNQQDDNPTIYSLFPDKYQALKTVGRLDKDSSGLILLTNDGDFAQEMTHPKFAKEKTYIVTTDRNVTYPDIAKINAGVDLNDGLSALSAGFIGSIDKKDWRYKVSMTEGRNRQIRRTFGFLDYTIIALKRVKFGSYELEGLDKGSFTEVDLR